MFFKVPQTEHHPSIMLKLLKIGDLELKHNVVLAPLAGITNLPFRILCRRAGASFAYTEMVSVNGLVRDGVNTRALLQSNHEDNPLGVQLFGDSPESLAQAARLVDKEADLIDINMGCPVKKVVGTGAGSALLKDTEKIAKIIKAVRSSTSKPLTIKIRSGWHLEDDLSLEVGHIAESEGCDAITFHPRSRSQMFSGKANWDQITRLKQSVNIPVIGSGDLFTAYDCVQMLKESGCDGIMIARGALGAPWIFTQIQELAKSGKFSTITPAMRSEFVKQHTLLFYELYGEAMAVREMKKHIGWYAKGFTGAAEIRRSANGIKTMEQLIKLADTMAMADCQEQIENEQHNF